jgi:hypothetical protein
MEPAHGIPTTAELAEAVREFLSEQVMPATEGRLSFHARVAANVVAQIERELTLGPGFAAAHATRLEQLGFADDTELCAAIRSGDFDSGLDELLATLRPSAIERLLICNPRHLLPEDRPT